MCSDGREMTADDHGLDSNSFHYSYDSIASQEQINTTSGVYRSRSYSVVIGQEVTPLFSKNRAILATQSISKLTTSNYFGFSSTAYATARQKERDELKSISLVHIPSNDRRTPTIVCFFTMLSMMTGLSVFAIPSVLSRCGLITLLLLAIVGMMTWYSSLLLNKCQHQYTKSGVKKRIYENFIDLGKAAIPWHGERLMQIAVGSSVLTDIYTLIFCAQVSIDLFNKYVQLENRIWMIIWISFIFPSFFIRKMSILSWLGTIALVSFVAGLFYAYALLFYHHKMWTWNNINPKFDFKYFFVGFGIILNSYNVHLAFPAIEASMKKPESYRTVCVAVFVVTTLFKFVLALVGAATFGVLTKGSVLSNLTTFGSCAITIDILLSVYLISQYPTSMFVVFEMLDLHLLPKYPIFDGTKLEWVWIFLSRLILSVFMLFVAVSVPNFELVTSFVGNIRGTIVTVILPNIFYLRIKGKDITKVEKVVSYFLIFISTLVGLVGASVAVMGMI